jgi:hypothetical protein
MANIICEKCGAVWTDEFGSFSSEFFRTPTLSNGVISLNQIFASGESLLACPKDPREPLDSAIQRSYDGPKSEARRTGRPVGEYWRDRDEL